MLHGAARALVVHKVNGDTRAAKAPRAPNAMQERLRVGRIVARQRRIVVHHQRYIKNINATRKHIRCYKKKKEERRKKNEE